MNRRHIHITAAVAISAMIAGASRADIVLKAATATNGGKSEVRLRWTITEGWFTDGAGFNVYRIQNGQRTKLNAQPIKAAEPNAAPTLNLGARQFKYGDMLLKARQHPVGAAEKDLFQINKGRAAAASSAPVFEAMRSQIQTVKQTPGPGLTATQFRMQIEANPTVGQYFTKVRSMAASPKPAAPNPVEATRFARSSLLVGAMVHQTVGKTLGLAYDDATAANGAAYTYALRLVSPAGAEAATDSATVDITVGADPQPPAPTGLAALQHDADRVDLRWTRLTTDETKPFGMTSYNLTRVDPAHAQGVKVNEVPIVIGDLPTASGHVEPASFYNDPDAPVGQITYKLTMVDMFGRESAPATLAFTMEDWHTPLPLKQAAAELKAPNVTVTWVASDEADVKYKVYRIDTEQPNAQPVLLTAQPIAGDPFNPNAPGFQRLGRIAATVQSHVARSQQIAAASKTLVAQPAAGGAAQPIAVAQPFRAGLSEQKVLLGETKRWSTIVIKQPSWLQFSDANAPKDHYYRYLVTEVYTRNNRDSAPAATTVVAIPQDAKPTAPANLKSDFTKAAASPAPSPSANGGEAQVKPITERATIVKQYKVNGRALAVAGLAQDTGGTVRLSWDPVPGQTKPVLYRIYRANATGYFPAAGQPEPMPTPSPDRPAAEAQGPKIAVQDAIRNQGFVYATKKRDLSAILVKPGLSYRYIDRLKVALEPSYALIGQTTDSTSFSDSMPRSHANYYLYRVVPVNRWGVIGAPTDLSVRVPATLAPSVPSMMAAFPAADGSVTVQIRPNPADEEVVRYHVLRKPMPTQYSVSPGQVGGGIREIEAQAAVVQPVNPGGPVEKVGGVGINQAVKTNVGVGQAAKINTPAAAALVAQAPGKIVVPIRATQKATVTYGGQSLIATGVTADRIGAGASRFGIVHKQSAFSSLMRYDAANKLLISPDFLKLLDIVGYEEVGVADAKNTDAGGLVNFADSKADPQQEYAYRIVAEDSDTLRSFPSSILDATAYKVKADPPTGVTAAFSAGGVKINWGAPKDGKGYIVERALSTDSKFIQISGILTAMSFTDFSGFPGRAYLYRVRAMDSAGNVSDGAAAAASVNIPR